MKKLLDNPWFKLLLCYFLGFTGIHKFLEKKKVMGILYLCTFGLFALGWSFDVFRYLFLAIKSLFQSKPTYSESQVEDLIRSAEQGDVRSQYTLGHLYRDGNSVEQNLDKCIYWLEKASENGHGGASLLLGRMYLYEINMPRKYYAARRLLKRAVEQTNSEEAKKKLEFVQMMIEKEESYENFVKSGYGTTNAYDDSSTGTTLRTGTRVNVYDREGYNVAKNLSMDEAHSLGAVSDDDYLKHIFDEATR